MKDLDKLMEMVKGTECRSRKCADRIISKLAMDVKGWEAVTITFSRVTDEYNHIIYKSGLGISTGFYDRNDEPWDITLRGAEYWGGILLIANWYTSKKIRYNRKRS